MSASLRRVLRAWARWGPGALVIFAALPLHSQTLTNVTLRVVAANLTSGNDQRYEVPGIRLFRGLKPDVVAIQEFNYLGRPSTPAQIRSLVDTAFGTNFVYYRETDPTYGIPNGVISRYPILASGSWVDSDAGVNDRGFAWARIDLPGTNDLYVVSVHLKASSGDSGRRAAQAVELKALIATNFPSGAWIIVAGDFNIGDASEAALATFKSYLSDQPIPTDTASGGDPDTNANRSERYDYVLPSFSLTNRLTEVVIGSHTFPNGLVFDSAVYTPLSEVSPVQTADSHVNGMQHMAVVKDFSIPYVLTNASVPPSIVVQPDDQRVNQAGTASFFVLASGSAPLGYQWRFGGVNLTDATNSFYTRANAQPEHMGDYSVVVTNARGSILSSNATLRLIVPAPMLATAPGLLRWEGLSNLNYTVESRTNLAEGGWLTVGQTSSPNGTFVFPLPDTNAAQLYFRVVQP